MIQVDTSGEVTKSGIDSTEMNELIEHVKSNCANLNIIGLMTIGAPGDLSCFDKLVGIISNIIIFVF